MSAHKNSGGSLSIGSLLLVAFVVLKLCGVINWSWWWVLSPLWMPILIAVICTVLIIIFDDK